MTNALSHTQARTALAHIAAGPALLRALGDTVTTATLERLAGGSGEASWMQRAVDVYREAVSGGCKPPAHIIERVLACLRQPTAPRPEAPAALPSPFKVSRRICLTVCRPYPANGS